MKSITLAIASLFLLSTVWIGSDSSPAPLADSYAIGKTRTPHVKSTKPAATKATKEKRAAKTPKPKKMSYSGEVIAVSEANLTIKTKDGEEISFHLSEDTTVKIPTLGKDATLADINIGVRALVRALKENDGSLTAVSISVSPGKPLPKHHVGVVTAYEPGVSITIEAHDGNEYTFLITEDTKLLPPERADELAVGRRVTIISPRDVTGGPFTAKGIVIHPETDSGTPEGSPTATPTPTETPTPTPTDTPIPELSPSNTPTPTSV
jgi:hypothetical protein